MWSFLHTACSWANFEKSHPTILKNLEFMHNNTDCTTLYFLKANICKYIQSHQNQDIRLVYWRNLRPRTYISSLSFAFFQENVLRHHRTTRLHLSLLLVSLVFSPFSQLLPLRCIAEQDSSLHNLSENTQPKLLARLLISVDHWCVHCLA